MGAALVQSQITLGSNGSFADPMSVLTNALTNPVTAGNTVYHVVAIANSATGGQGSTPVITPPLGFSTVTPLTSTWVGPNNESNLYGCGQKNQPGGATQWTLQFGSPPAGFGWFLTVITIELSGSSITLDGAAVISKTSSVQTLTATGSAAGASAEAIIAFLGVDGVDPGAVTGPGVGYTLIQSQDAGSTEPMYAWFGTTTNGVTPAPTVSWANAGGQASLGLLVFTNNVAPVVTTGAAKTITPSSATLQSTVNTEGLDTTYLFNYGLTSGYGSTSLVQKLPGAASSGPANLIQLTGLAANTTYHFQISATNAIGTATGSDATFTTNSQGSAIVPYTGDPSWFYGGADTYDFFWRRTIDSPIVIPTNTGNFFFFL